MNNTHYTQRTLDYLAAIHLTGYFPSGIHKGSQHSTYVFLNYTFNTDTKRFEVKEHIIPLLANHPMVQTIKALEAEGYVVNRSRIITMKRWTISKGIPMRHSVDLRTGAVYMGGTFHQWENEAGRWCSSTSRIWNPGKNAKEKAQWAAAARISRAYDQEGVS